MDWNLAIEKNREALQRILAMLFAMIAATGVDLHAGGDQAVAEAPPTNLPRHLHRMLLRLLRPAEAAARRLIIVAARGLVVELSPPRIRKPQSKPIRNRSNGFGTGVVIRPGPLPEWARVLAPKRSSALSLSLFDPLKRFGVRRRYGKPGAAPRIRMLDDMRAPLFHQPRAPEPPPPSPDDPLDATRLTRRLEAIGRVLNDLPREAKRFARWRARRDAMLEQERSIDAGAQSGNAQTVRRFQRLEPMRPGRPPGWRRRPGHPVDDILTELHGLAVWAQERPDTS